MEYIIKPYDIDEFRMRVINFLSLAASRKSKTADSASSQASSILTEKELIVASLAARGLLNKEIADKVNLSESRVKTCLSGIYRKLEISEKANKRELLTEKLK